MHTSVSNVVENRDLGHGVWLLRLRDADLAADCVAGCFVMVGVGVALSPVLRRPFSVQRVQGDIYDILYRDVGLGTGLMTQLVAGEDVPVLGPLGNSFTMPQPGERAVLLGGGVGIPPMVALADRLEAAAHRDWEAFLGVAGEADSGCFVGFDERYGPETIYAERVHRATMDGTVGFEGHVVAAWLDCWEAQGAAPAGPSRIYACGPMVMLRAVAQAAQERGIPCEVSVETMMGCGMGACMSCVIESSEARDPVRRAAMSPYDRWLLACRKGPVFDSRAIVLEDGEFLH